MEVTEQASSNRAQPIRGPGAASQPGVSLSGQPRKLKNYLLLKQFRSHTLELQEDGLFIGLGKKGERRRGYLGLRNGPGFRRWFPWTLRHAPRLLSFSFPSEDGRFSFSPIPCYLLISIASCVLKGLF